jgi:DNA repair exonuclease SbcCD ATPase subunit
MSKSNEFSTEIKSRLEIEKLQEEVRDLRSWIRRWVGSLGTFFGIVAGGVSLFYAISSSSEAEQKRTLALAETARAEARKIQAENEAERARALKVEAEKQAEAAHRMEIEASNRVAAVTERANDLQASLQMKKENLEELEAQIAEIRNTLQTNQTTPEQRQAVATLSTISTNARNAQYTFDRRRTTIDVFAMNPAQLMRARTHLQPFLYRYASRIETEVKAVPERRNTLVRYSQEDDLQGAQLIARALRKAGYISNFNFEQKTGTSGFELWLDPNDLRN